ncbi:MAG: 5-oxoprolinase subunit PxpB [Acidobacteriota bacterium]
MTSGPAFCDLADGAAVIEYPGVSDSEANRAAVALADALCKAPIEGLRDAIPGARTLFLAFDPRVLPHDALRREALSRAGQPLAPGSGRAHPVGVLYGGEMGPDLEDLASRAGMTPQELASRHARGDYTVAFLGFAPGFAYLTGLDPALHAPRLSTPRPRVPARSVAIGGPYTGIYPSSTPGGWRLIGRCAVSLFEEESDPPALLRPGDGVRFEPVTAAQFVGLERELEEASSRSPTSPGGLPVFRVVKPGVFTSVQGMPQVHRGASGLPPGGAFDEGALASGNARLGNAPGTGALEMTLLGPELEVLSEVGACVSGASMALERNGVFQRAESPIRLASGDRLRFAPARSGTRAYLCVEGGLQAPGRLGLTRRLESGHILMRGGGKRQDAVTGPERSAPIGADGAVVLRVVLDPRRDRLFDSRAVDNFLSTAFRVSSTSDRRGIRLEGSAVEGVGSLEMPPEGTALGTIQVPPDGQPILLGPDRPVTGGYARLGTVIAADWARIVQAPPGRTVRFEAVTRSEALEARE